MSDLVAELREWAKVNGWFADGDVEGSIGTACYLAAAKIDSLRDDCDQWAKTSAKQEVEIENLRELLLEIWRHRNGGSALSSSWDRRVTEVLETNGPT